MTKKEKLREWYLKNREKVNATKRAWRKANNNSDTHKYEKTPNGFIMRLYRNMESRVTGIQWKKAHLYKGKEILPREDFYNWAKPNPKFLTMFKTWTEKGYDRRLTPTVNRINPQKGYTLDNMEWLTHSENSRLVTRKKI
jgi:hypothetical protein